MPLKAIALLFHGVIFDNALNFYHWFGPLYPR